MKDDRRTRARSAEQALRELINAEIAHERAARVAADEQRAAECAARVAEARDRYQRLTAVA